MTMESLGGDMPAGQPVAVSFGNRTHVFAIAKGGSMNRWDSTDGGQWVGPTALPGGSLAASIPCTIALADGSMHVFAIGQGGALSSGGPLTWWSSTDGINWTLQSEQGTPIPGGWNGLAVASSDGQQIDVFAMTSGGIIQFSIVGGQAVSMGALPGSTGFPPRILSAVSSSPGTLDVFAVDAQLQSPIHWRFNGTWSKQVVGATVHPNSGLAAISSRPGHIDLFAITPAGMMMALSVDGMMGAAKPFIAASIPAGPWALPEGVPAVVARGQRLDLFAIGSGGVLNGGPLVRWVFDGTWQEPQEYDSGLAAGGIGAVRSAFGVDAFGFQSGGSNPLLHWPAGIKAYGPDRWRNWAGNRETNPIEGHCTPTCLEELVAIVRTATQAGKRARAVGSSWSFGDIAVTPGYVVETNRLNRPLGTNKPAGVPGPLSSLPPKAQVVKPKPVVPEAVIPGPHHLVHVEAGIQLEDLMTFLDLNTMAPATMGGASGQTLAGVLSTSVHGSHFHLPPISDWVRAIHLVGPDGMQYWIEPEDRPITKRGDRELLQEALGPEVTIVHDDEWFNAALVTVGALGIIYSVVLEVRDQYKLHETRTRLLWSALKPQFEDSSVFAKGVDCVAIAVDPGSVGNDSPTCILATRVAVSADAVSVGQPTFDPLGAFCEGDLILELLFEAARAVGTPSIVIPAILAVLPSIPAVLALTVLFPPALAALTVLATTAAAAAATVAAATSILYPLLKAAGPGAIGDLVGGVLNRYPGLVGALASLVTTQFQGPTPPEGVVDIAHNVMGPRNRGECATRGLGLELAFDEASYIKFIDAAIALLKDEAAMGRMLGGWISMRFVGQSRAFLSPQQTKRTCMVEFVGLRTLRSTGLLFAGLEALGREHGGIQHWGMFFDENNLTATDVKRAYPRLKAWKRVRRELTAGGTIRTFDNDFTVRCGLSDPPVRIQSIDFDPPGDDVAGEQVVIRNETTVAITLTGWTLRDAANHVFTFPLFVLQGASDVRVWTKAGTNDAGNLFWGHRSAIWNNTGDTAVLRDQGGTEVARFVYR